MNIELVVQLLSLGLIVGVGPIVVVLITLRQGSL